MGLIRTTNTSKTTITRAASQLPAAVLGVRWASTARKKTPWGVDEDKENRSENDKPRSDNDHGIRVRTYSRKGQ